MVSHILPYRVHRHFNNRWVGHSVGRTKCKCLPITCKSMQNRDLRIDAKRSDRATAEVHAHYTFTCYIFTWEVWLVARTIWRLAQGHHDDSCWSNSKPLTHLLCRLIVKIPLVCMTELDNFLNIDRLQGRRAFSLLPHCIRNHKLNMWELLFASSLCF